MRNVGIYRAHKVIQYDIKREGIMGGDIEGKNEHINGKLQSKRRLAHHDTAVADEEQHTTHRPLGYERVREWTA